MAEQDSRVREGNPGAISTSRPLVLLETYRGEGNWSGWAEHFESVAAVNGWKEPKKLLWLSVCLVGRAAIIFKRVPDRIRDSYVDCMAVLKTVSIPGADANCTLLS